MDILYLLIPMSALAVLAIIGAFGWALHRGQFDDLDREGERILDPDADGLDLDQPDVAAHQEQSPAEPGGSRRGEH